MNKQNSKITLADSKRCQAAIVAIDKLAQGAKASKYPSLAVIIEDSKNKLGRLKLWYQSNAGRVIYKGMVLPLNEHAVGELRGSASVLYAYAYNKSRLEKIEGWRKDIIKVTERTMEILDWLGKQ